MRSKEQTEKWKKILSMMPLFCLYSFGASLAGIVGKVLFVENVGSQYLPQTYVVVAILGSILTIVSSAMMKKMSTANLLQLFSWGGAGLFLVNYLMMGSGSLWAYTLFLITSSCFYLILGGTVVWRIAGNVSTLFESKGTFMYYSLASSLGGIVAGIASNSLEEFWGLERLIILICGSLVLAAINLALIQRNYREQLQPVLDEESKNSKWDSVKTELQDFKKTRLAKMLLVALTIFNVVWSISDFEFQKIVGDNFSETQYSKFLGLLSIVNSVGLILALFIQEKIIKKAGVLNTLLMSPALVFVAFLVFFIFPIPASVFMVCAITPVVGYSIFSESSMFAFTALPHSIRNRVATFISGNSDSIALLLTGLGLMLLTEFVDNSWIIALACVLLLADVILLFSMKKVYLQQVLINLGSTNPVDMHGAIENLAESTYKEVGVQEMMKLISWRNLDDETVRKMVFALGKIGNVKVIPSLLELFKKHNTNIKYSIVETIHSFGDLNEKLEELPFTKRNLIEAYEEIFLEEEDVELKVLILERLGDFDPEEVITFLRNAIKDKNPEVSTKAIAAMRYFHDRGIITYVRPHLEDKNPMTQAAAVISLWQFEELKPLLMKSFVQIMAGTSREHILSSLNLIGSLEFALEKSYAEKQMSQSEKSNQRGAILTLLQLDDTEGVPLVVNALVEKRPGSLFFARSLKKIPSRIQKLILKEVQKKGEHGVKTCIDILKSSYLDFTEEISFLEGGSTAMNRSR